MGEIIEKIELELLRQNAIKQEMAELRAQIEEIILNSFGCLERIYRD